MMTVHHTMEGHVGFTGTRGRLTEKQKAAMDFIFMQLYLRGWTELHLGDARGADTTAWLYASQYFRLHGHPCDIDSQRAYLTYYFEFPIRPPLDRNRDIVNLTAFLVATPDGPEVLRSGTWATVRYARKLGRDGRIIYPDGTVTML